jgi:hypothetical protein
MTKPARLIYATLVRGYPRGFRDEYGPAMMQAFDESLHCAIAEQGVLGVFRLAGRLAVDWAKTMLGEWAEVSGSWGRAGSMRWPAAWALTLAIYLLWNQNPAAAYLK